VPDAAHVPARQTHGGPHLARRNQKDVQENITPAKEGNSV
jgi:hypothetical protein